MTAFDMMWVGLGGGLGALLRYVFSVQIKRRYQGIFPLATFTINIFGAFVIGFLSVLFGVDWASRIGTPVNAAIITGFLGGYTTFSSMQLEASHLIQNNKTLRALTYLTASTALGMAAAALGAWLAMP